MTFLKKLFNFCASYGFAVVILTLLLLLTLFGTLEQADQGLFVVTKKYFESFFVVHELFGIIPIPLPGVYLLLVLLFINLLCGAIIRAPKNWRRPGMLIAHFGILYLIFAGFVTYHFSISGYMQLFENQSSNEFVSYYDYEIAITEYSDGKPSRKVLIPHEHLAHLEPSDQREFQFPHLPFDLAIEGFVRNSQPKQAPADLAEIAVDGIMLEALPLELEAERNMAGVYAKVLPHEGEPQRGLLWRFSLAPWMVSVEGKQYVIDLRHTRTEVPFTVRLDKFIRELHPRTGIASNFESEITKIENGVGRQINIRMNEPLRHEGYTFFQASWGPEGAGPDTPLFSVFSVVKNPADQWPLYACLVIAAGLLIHFLQKLGFYLRAENRRRA